MVDVIAQLPRAILTRHYSILNFHRWAPRPHRRGRTLIGPPGLLHPSWLEPIFDRELRNSRRHDGVRTIQTIVVGNERRGPDRRSETRGRSGGVERRC